MDNELFLKGEEYKNTVSLLVSNDVYNSSTTVLNELAMECYLKSMIEILSGKNIDSIYGKGLVPHSLDTLYGDLVNKWDKNREYFSFDRRLQRELKSAFKDYNESRFPKPDSYKIIDDECIKFNIDLCDEISTLTKDFINQYEKNQEEILEK